MGLTSPVQRGALMWIFRRERPMQPAATSEPDKSKAKVD
jgi:hypothetical protein